MGQDIAMNQEGTFRGMIREYGARQTKTGAIQLRILADIEEIWDPELEQFVDWREYEVIVEGDLNLVQKNGSINKTQVKALIEHTGWDGNFTSLSDGTWKPTPCQFSVKRDTYYDEPRYRVDWINGYDDTPRGISTMDLDEAKALQNRLGGEMRAVVGNTTRQKQKPAGAPVAPRKATAPSVAEAATKAPVDGVPF